MKTPIFSWIPFSTLYSLHSTFLEKRKNREKTFLYKHFPRFTLQNKYINFLFHIFSYTFYETKQGGEREREREYLSFFSFLSFSSFRSKYWIHKFWEYSDMIWCWWRWASTSSWAAKMATKKTKWWSGRLGYRVSTIWRHYHSCWYRQNWLQRLVVHWNPTGPQWKSTAHRKLSTLRGVNHLTTKGSLFETTDPNPNSD